MIISNESSRFQLLDKCILFPLPRPAAVCRVFIPKGIFTISKPVTYIYPYFTSRVVFSHEYDFAMAPDDFNLFVQLTFRVI